VSYAIGVAEPTSVSVETFGTEHVAVEKIEQLVRQEFDLRPYAIIHSLDLIRPIYRPLAAYGHMGREDLGVSWEKTDRAESLRDAAGL
jgi:S-adenosylmethionine synthetase